MSSLEKRTREEGGACLRGGEGKSDPWSIASVCQGDRGRKVSLQGCLAFEVTVNAFEVICIAFEVTGNVFEITGSTFEITGNAFEVMCNAFEVIKKACEVMGMFLLIP